MTSPESASEEPVRRVHNDQTFVSAPDEALLPKIYDSRRDLPARLTAHTAFDDPTSPAHAPARRSIELRTLVFCPAEQHAPSI